MSIIHFFDSVDPELIPSGTYATLYYDGKYAVKNYVNNPVVKRFAHVRWISVLGDYEHCGLVDYEQGNEIFSKADALRNFVKGRINIMHARSRIYCDRANLESVREKLEGLEYLVWLATLDGNILTPKYTANLWGVQYTGNARYDESILYGTW